MFDNMTATAVLYDELVDPIEGVASGS